jgi:hypothetical protein
MEELLASWYEDEQDCELRYSETLVDPTVGWAVATPDRIGAGYLVECKHVGDRVAWHWHDGPPDYVVAQCVWQMMVARAVGILADRVDVVADIGGAPPQVFPVLWDDELEQETFERVRSFYLLHIERDVAPPVDGSDSYQEWLRRQFPASNGSMRVVPDGSWAKQYVEAKAAIDAATKQKELAANMLRAIVGEDDGIMGEWGRVTNRSNKAGNRSLSVKLADGKPRKQRGTTEDL